MGTSQIESAIDELQATQIIEWADVKWVRLDVAHGHFRALAAHLEAEQAEETGDGPTPK